MSELHTWVAQWCGSNMPGWLPWQVLEPLDGTPGIKLSFGTGSLCREYWIFEDGGLAPRLTQLVQLYLTDLRDRCDQWLLRHAVASTLPPAPDTSDR